MRLMSAKRARSSGATLPDREEDPLPEQAFQDEWEGADGLHEIEAIKGEAFAQEILCLLTASATDCE